MRNLRIIYFLPLCLCCFTVFGQQPSNRYTSRDTPAPSKEMLEKFKQNEGWVKLSTAIQKQGETAGNLSKQIDAQNEVILMKTRAKQDASADRARLNQLEKSLAPLSANLSKMKKQRDLIEAEIKLRESNKK